MKTILFSAFCLVSLFTFSQVAPVLGGLVSDLVLDDEFKIQTNSQKVPYVGYITSQASGRTLKVSRYQGGQWENSDSGLALIDSNVIDFDLKSSFTSDSLFLSYTKSDGVYIRSFDPVQGWSSATYFAMLPFSADQTLRMALDTASMDVYCLVRSDSDESHLLYLENGVGVISELNAPADLNPFFFYASDLLYDETGDQLLASYQNNTADDVIKYFDGLSWVPLVDNIVFSVMNRTMLDQSTLQPDEIGVSYTSSIIGGYGVGISRANTQTGSLEVVQGQHNPAGMQSLAVEAYGYAISPVTDASVYAYMVEGIIPTLYYSNGTDEEFVMHNMFLLIIKDICFDKDGRLYLVGYQPGAGLLRVHYIDSFLSLTELDGDSARIYPNPALDYIEINVEGLYQYELLNSEGNTVKEGAGKGLTELSLHELSNQVYYLRITGENGAVTVEKIVKQ